MYPYIWDSLYVNDMKLVKYYYPKVELGLIWPFARILNYVTKKRSICEK